MRWNPCPTFGALLLALAGAGCVHKPQPDAFSQAVRMGERPVAMSGATPFFGGEVLATVTISNGVGKGHPVAAGKGKGGGKDEFQPVDLSSLKDEDVIAYIHDRQALGSPLPPVTLRLQLKNLSKSTLAVEVEDLNSDLGDFAVQPSLFKLAPQQAAEPNPMISQLGVTSDTLPTTVSLSLDGRTETHVLQVKNLLDEKPAPAPAPKS